MLFKLHYVNVNVLIVRLRKRHNVTSRHIHLKFTSLNAEEKKKHKIRRCS